jgi:hypothetical protein
MAYVIHCELEGWITPPKPRRWWEPRWWFERRLRAYRVDAVTYLCAAQDAEDVPQGARIPSPEPYGQRFVLKPAFRCPDYGPYDARDTAQLLVDRDLNQKAQSVWNRGTIGPHPIFCAYGHYRPRFFVAEN